MTAVASAEAGPEDKPVQAPLAVVVAVLLNVCVSFRSVRLPAALSRRPSPPHLLGGLRDLAGQLEVWPLLLGPAQPIAAPCVYSAVTGGLWVLLAQAARGLRQAGL